MTQPLSRDFVRCSGCRRKFSPTLLDAAGLCPACLDPALYKLCQRIEREENARWRMDGGGRRSKKNLGIIKRMAAQIRNYNRRMPGEPLPPVVAERLVAGYEPTARSGKRGGPNHKGGD